MKLHLDALLVLIKYNINKKEALQLINVMALVPNHDWESIAQELIGRAIESGEIGKAMLA